MTALHGMSGQDTGRDRIRHVAERLAGHVAHHAMFENDATGEEPDFQSSRPADFESEIYLIPHGTSKFPNLTVGSPSFRKQFRSRGVQPPGAF
jgi:hypothetical protein